MPRTHRFAHRGANCVASSSYAAHLKIALDLEFLLADTGRLIPVDLGHCGRVAGHLPYIRPRSTVSRGGELSAHLSPPADGPGQRKRGRPLIEREPGDA